jgi:TPR repeat protein|tara:strand:- start:14 stop:340 length:327 start_codon:yes stop_codon:yes gene_type:complete
MITKKSEFIRVSKTNSKVFSQHNNIANPSAEEKNAMALAKLGSKYEKGIGVFTNHVKAYMWYFIAEHKGNDQAGFDRERMTNKMTPTQVDKAQAMARQCLPDEGLYRT